MMNYRHECSWIERWKTKWVKVAKGKRCTCVESIKYIEKYDENDTFSLFFSNILNKHNGFEKHSMFSVWIFRILFFFTPKWERLSRCLLKCMCKISMHLSPLWVSLFKCLSEIDLAWIFTKRTITDDHAKQQSTSIPFFFSYKNRMNVWFMTNW